MRSIFIALALAVTALPAAAQDAPALTFGAAGKGSAFLPYALGVKGVLDSAGLKIEVRETKGSNENLDLVDADPTMIALAFMGSAVDAMNGTGWAKGRPRANVRALFPTYETSFQIVALTSSKLRALGDLDGRRVGVGPAAGPAEVYFRAAAEVAGIKPTIVNGTSDELARAVISGGLDALWQGAVVPIPAIRQVQDGADAVVFGLSDEGIETLVKRLPALSPTTIPGGTYKGQTAPIRSIGAWNVVIAHKDLPPATAYALTKAVLSVPDPAAAIGPAAAATKASSAASASALPYHPGAARFLAEQGVTLPAR